MAYKVTIQNVDNGQEDNGSFTIYTNAQAPLQPDALPVELVLQDSNITGATINALKKMLTLAALGKLSTLSPAAAVDTSLFAKINAVYTELNP